MKQFQLNPRQQQEFAARFNKEMDNLTMSWDNQLKEWHPVALEALTFANVRDLNIAQNKFIELFAEEPQGVNMDVVRVLCNNLESRCAWEMDYEAREWADILLLNHEIATRWQALALPFQEKLYREFEIMNNKANSIMKLAIGEA